MGTLSGNGARKDRQRWASVNSTENLWRSHEQEDDADAIQIDEIDFGSGEVKDVLHPVTEMPISHLIQCCETINYFLTE
jgi:hypothetical protein